MLPCVCREGITVPFHHERKRHLSLCPMCIVNLALRRPCRFVVMATRLAPVRMPVDVLPAIDMSALFDVAAPGPRRLAGVGL